MAATLKLEIVTPEAKIFADDVEMVTLTGIDGEMGIYPDHMPVMTQLVAGEICARKIQRFLSQPFSVAQVFTGREGKQVPVAETVRAFKEILDGKHDDVPEQNFYMKGGIEEIKEG